MDSEKISLNSNSPTALCPAGLGKTLMVAVGLVLSYIKVNKVIGAL